MLHRNTAQGRSGARRARSDLAQEELCHVKIPADHPLRLELNHEVHARPPEALAPPLRLTVTGSAAPGTLTLLGGSSSAAAASAAAPLALPALASLADACPDAVAAYYARSGAAQGDKR